jgi:hypothetical protein
MSFTSRGTVVLAPLVQKAWDDIFDDITHGILKWYVLIGELMCRQTFDLLLTPSRRDR